MNNSMTSCSGCFLQLFGFLVHNTIITLLLMLPDVPVQQLFAAGFLVREAAAHTARCLTHLCTLPTAAVYMCEQTGVS
jgi:hypothetical protein